jgi:hypothetical protein
MVREAFHGAHEVGTRNTTPKTGNKVRILIGIEHAPHLGFRFTLQLGGDSGGRMNLQRKPLAGVEKFDEQGEMGSLTAIGSQKLRAMGVYLLT